MRSKVAPPLLVLLTGAYHPPVSHLLAVILRACECEFLLRGTRA